MTTAYQIIVDAYRQSNLLALGVAPTQAQEVEALRYLNRILKSVYGNEVGDPLIGVPIGNNNIERPAGYPYWEDQPTNAWFVPKNVRLNLNLTSAQEVFLTPAPEDGTRFAIVDASDNLATFPLTIKGNGAMIEGTTSIVLNTNGLDREWMFRADRGEWVRCSPIELFDTFPFPEEFDDYFILTLAFRLNPAYERTLDPQSAELLHKAKTQIRARYSQTVQTPSELALIRPSITAQDRDFWINPYGWGDSTSLFRKGWPFPW